MKKLSVVLLALISIMAISLSACTSRIEFKVSFVVDGEVYATVRTNGGETIKMPENPTKDDYTFDGWYWDEGTWSRPFTMNSLLDAPLSSDMSVYAKWTKNGTTPGGEDPSNPGGTTPGGEEPSTPGGTTPGGEDPSNPGGTTPGGEDPSNPGGTTPGGEDPSNPGGTTPGGEDPSTPGGTTPGGEDPSNPGGEEPKPEEKKKHTVTFDSQGGSTVAAQTIEEGSKVDEPSEEPTKTGYTFEGWYKDAECLTEWKFDAETVANDFTLYAKWTPIEYALEFNLRSGSYKEGKSNPTIYTIEDTITFVEPEREGYTFGGWYENESCTGNKVGGIELGTTGKKTYYAKWEIVEYNITYNLNDGESNSEENINTYTVETSFEFKPATKKGYEFLGWYTDEQCEESTKKERIEQGETGALELYPKWKTIEYNITYNLGDGESNNEENIETYTVETSFEFKAATKKGYEFLGWYTDEQCEESTKKERIEQGETGALNLYPKWAPIDYEITYNNVEGAKNSNNPSGYTVDQGGVITLSDPTKEGYTFGGWYENESFAGEQVSTIDPSEAKDIELWAKWTPIEYSIKYENLNGAQNENKETYTVEDDEITLANPTRKGYTFDGWYENAQFTGDKVESIPHGSTGHKTLWAKWEIVNYTITYNLGDGESNNEENIETYTVEMSFEFKPATKKGYEFLGWYTDEQCEESTKKERIEQGETGALNLYPKWKIVNYTITYNLGEGESNDKENPETYTVEMSFEFKPATKKGYEFLGWYTDEQCDESTKKERIEQGEIGALELYPKWKVVDYTITYNLNDGESNDEENIETYTVDMSFDFKSATKKGYEFLGWYTDKDCDESTKKERIEQGEIGALNLYPKWAPIDYEITYNNVEGAKNSNNPSGYTVDQGGVITLSDPTREGYSFDGWYEDDKFTGEKVETIDPSEAKDIELWAKWTPIEYSIKYENLNGAQNVNEETYTVEDEDITLKDPTRKGYTFDGWYENAQFTGDKVESIPHGSTGHKTLWAKWEIIDYTITYNLNEGESNNEENIETYTVEMSFEFKAATKKGYEFLGWYTDKDCTDGKKKERIEQGETGALELYPKWKTIEYTITYNLNDGTNNEENRSKYTVEDDEITLKDPTKEGYTFDGWYENDKFTGEKVESIPHGSTGHKTLWAKWKIVEYNITYNLSEDESNDEENIETYTVETSFEFKVATKKGYEFLGWYTDEQCDESTKKERIEQGETGALNLYPKWKIVEYGITYNLNDGTNNEENRSKYTVEDEDITLKDPTKEGYTFGGWYENESCTGEKVETIDPREARDIELWAKWTPIEYSIKYENLNGAQNENKETYTVEDEDITLKDPTREGYTFIGWFDAAIDGEQVSTIDPSEAKDIELWARWEATEYTATFKADEKTIGTVQFTVETEKLDEPAVPEKNGYDGKWQDYKIAAGDMTIEAEYTLIEYEITYELDNGQNADKNPSTYNIENEVTLQDPQKEGYTFDGWYTSEQFDEGTKTNKIEKGSTGKKTFYAKWEATNYTATFKAGEETIGTVQFTVETEKLDEPAVPEKDGYTGKWSEYEIGPNDLTISAEYTLIEYEITYELDNGQNADKNPSTYNIENEVTLQDPQKEGYTFDGWYTSEQFDEGTRTNKIEKGSTGKKTFYAKWLAQTKGLQYTCVDDTYYKVTGYSGSDRIVIIPDKWEGLPVQEIGERAFSGCSRLTNVTIPDSVTTIGSYAFYGCSGLTEITIPENVTRIGSYAFYGCSGLTEITILGNITSIGDSTFSGCSRLTNVTIPDSVQTIGSYAFHGCGGLTSITIGSGVQTIGDSAFFGCSGLTSVTIGNSVQTIDSYAFEYCSGLEMITIPGSVTSIGAYAFKDCSGLMEVTIGSGVQTIGAYAFEDCSGLQEITIPGNVQTIGSSAFSGCNSLESITLPFVGANKEQTGIHFGYIFGASSSSDNSRYVPKSLKTVIITSATSIGSSAFRDCSGLMEVTIGSGVQTIGDDAFYGCSGLTSITIPDSVTSIGAGAFEDCSSLQEIAIPESVTSIGRYAFEGCSGLEMITIPDSVTSIGDYAFSGCSGLTSVVWNAENCTSGGSHIFRDAGHECTLTIGDNVTNIPGGAFYNFTGLISVTIPDSVTSIGDSAFSGCSGLTSVTIGSGVQTIGNYAFYGCSSLQEVTWNATNCTSAGSDNGPIFKDAGSDCTLTIGENVTSIPGYAFREFTGLISVTIDSMAHWLNIDFSNSSANPLCNGAHLYLENGEEITSLEIPEGIIKAYAFYGCGGLQSVTIGSGVQTIGSYAFSGCGGLTSVVWNATNCTVSDYIFRGAGNECTLTIGDNVTNIPKDAFRNFTGLANVTIGESVQTIGSYAFSGCNSLESITLPFVGANKEQTGSTHFGYIFGASSYSYNSSYVPKSLKTVIITSATSIGDHAFCDCSGLTSITIPDSVTSIGSSAFYGCSGLEMITIPDSVTSIGDSAFYGCSGLMEVTIGSGVQTIGDSAFRDCSGITKIAIPESVQTIGWSAFYGCSGLQSVTIGKSVQTIDSYAFYGCSSLQEVTWNATNCTSAGSDNGPIFKNAGSDCTLTIGENVTSIPGYAFREFTGLISVTILGNITNIGEYAFYGCSGLEMITILGNITSIGDSTFSGCSRLTNVTIPDSVTTIGDNAFSGCSSLQEITIPENVETIGNCAFYGCSGLTSVIWNATNCTSAGSDDYPIFSGVDNECTLTIGENVTNIPERAFYNFTGLISVTIPENVETIGNCAFYGCSGLTSVIWNATNCTKAGAVSCYRYIFENAGSNCTLIIGENVTNIPENAFRNFTGLISVIWNATNCASAGDTYGNYPIFGHAGSDCTLTIGEKVISIPENAFRNFTGLTSVTIPDSVTTIGDGAFYGCSSLTEITIPENVTSIGSSVFRGCSRLEMITILGNITSIGDAAFYGCSGLERITIPDSVTSIGNWAFQNCSGLTSVIWNATNCTSVGYSIFENAGNECTLTIGENVTNIPKDAFEEFTGLISVTIGSGVQTIGDCAFMSCSGLMEVTIGKNVQTIGSSAFGGCSNLNTVKVDSMAHWLNIDFYNSSANPLCKGAHLYLENGEEITSLEIPEGIIKAYAFYGCSGLTSVTIGSGVQTIGKSAFNGCTSLESVIWNATNCTSADPYSYHPIFEYAGNECTLTIGDNVTNIPKYAFYNFTGLISVTIPENVETIGGSAFEGCSGLTSVIWNATNCTSAGDNDYYPIFENAGSNCTLTIGENVISIPEYTFRNFTGLISVIWDAENCTSAGDTNGYRPIFENAGSNCTLTIGEKVTNIPKYAFCNFTGLTSVTIGKNVQTIGDYAFYGCSGFEMITIPDSVTSIGDAAFYGCSNLQEITIPDSVTSIGDAAFRGCSGLTSVTIGNSVQTIGKYAFNGCTSLESVIWNATNCTSAGDTNGYSPIFENAGSNCTLIIGENVTNIPENAFYNFTGLASVIMGSKVKTIGSYAFGGQTSNLKSVYYKGTSTQWKNIKINSGNVYLTDAERYYYSQEFKSGYWHYKDGTDEIEIWQDQSAAASTVSLPACEAILPRQKEEVWMQK